MTSLMEQPSRWPVVLREGAVELRALRRRDAAAWRQVRLANEDWLRPWEATAPDGSGYSTFPEMVRASNRMGRTGQGAPFGIFVDGRFAGQITLSCVVWGSLRSGSVGYWVDQRVAGRGVAPLAVAMVCDHAWFTMGLHRIEVNIRPENTASLRVVEKLAFRDEGVREKFLHINGQWCDHRTFALTVEERPEGLVAAWRRRAD